MRRRSSGAKLPRMTTAQSPAPLVFRGLLLVCALAFTSGAWAQWQWKDATGRRIFSDTPPPASVPERDILQQPGRRSAPAAAASNPSDADAAPAASVTPKPQGVDPQLDDKKKQLEKAEADKKQAENKAIEAKNAKIRADNCESARRSKAALDSGLRITTTNAKGEAEYLDEAARATRLRQVNELIRENCR